MLVLAVLAVAAWGMAARLLGTGAGGECLRLAPRPPAGAEWVQVARVVDGDTFVAGDGTRVRLLGIDTPESVDPRRPVERLGMESAAFTRQLLEGRSVWLAPGRNPRDRYGRLLAWVWLEDGRFVNALLVAEGFAQVYTFSDNPEYAELLVECQREARQAGKGLWAE